MADANRKSYRRVPANLICLFLQVIKFVSHLGTLVRFVDLKFPSDKCRCGDKQAWSKICNLEGTCVLKVTAVLEKSLVHTICQLRIYPPFILETLLPYV